LGGHDPAKAPAKRGHSAVRPTAGTGRARVPKCPQPQPLPLLLTGNATGLDLGVNGVLLTAHGEAIEHPRHSHTAEQALAKAQKRLSRRTKRSTRWWKAARLVATPHQNGRRHRHEVHHTTARALVRQEEVAF